MKELVLWQTKQQDWQKDAYYQFGERSYHYKLDIKRIIIEYMILITDETDNCLNYYNLPNIKEIIQIGI